MVKTLAGFVLITSIAIGAQAQDGSRLRTTLFHGMELPYEVIDGLAIHAGDMILGTAEEAAAHSPERVPPRSQGFRIRDDRVSHALPPCCSEILWPQGIIPYVIDVDVPKRKEIRKAIRIWHDETAVRFIERTTERDYLRFTVRNEGGCTAVTGRGFNGGERIMPIASNGCSWPIMLHELGHAVGLGHEQQRKDRDRWVTVFKGNINPGDGAGQWHPHPLYGEAIGPYDYRSVMHYAFFSDDMRRHGESRMMESIPPGMPMAQTVELSPGDVDSVARLYGYQPTAHVVSTNPAGLEIIVDGVRMTAPATFDWRPNSEHTLEVPSPQFRPGSRFLFGRWSDDGGRAHMVPATPDTTLYQASFIAQHEIAASVDPPGAGHIEIAPASPDGYYTLRTPVELSVHASPGTSLRFLDWEVETDFWWSWYWPRFHGASSNPARTLTTAGLAYRASFVDGPIFRIDSNVDHVPVVVNGWERPTPVAFPSGRLSGSTTVAARPIEDWRRSYRHRFRSWSDGGDIEHTIDVPPTDTTLTLTLDTDYQLTTRPPANGDGEIDTTPFSEDGFYPDGTEVRLLATAVPPRKFIGWNGSVSGRDPAALVVMDDGKLAQAVVAHPRTALQPGVPAEVSLRWNGNVVDFTQHYVQVPADASELEIEFRTRAATAGAEAGLFVTTHGELGPDLVGHENADLLVLRDGVARIEIRRPNDRWPAAYFFLIRAAESESLQTQTLEGTLVASVKR